MWIKNRSLGQILEKPCVRYRENIVSPILIKQICQNVCINIISVVFEDGLCMVKN